tara:strand:- start:220 stop:417 length:198 start_codon:yes stop_codon:yes gene_type:complete
MCAPAPVTPPANALEVEEELMLELIEKIRGYRPSEQKTEVTDTINNALDDFWKDQDSFIDESVKE